MTRIMLAALAFPAFAVLAAPAAAADRRYSVTDFDRVIIEGPYTARLTVGGPSAAMVSGTQAGIERVIVDVQSRTLRIRRNRSAWGGMPGADTGPITITLATRSLRSARTIGPALLDVDGGRGLNLEFVVEGSGRIRAANVAADNLSLGLLGSGGLQIAGTARALRADFQGTGNVDGSHLLAQNATVTTNTSGAVAFTVNGPATVHANGLGEVVLLGRAICTVDGPGTEQVRCAASNQR